MADDRKLREQLRSLAQVPAPPRDLAAVVRRHRTLRVRRTVVALAVAGIAAAGVIVPLVELSGLKGATGPATGESTDVRFEAARGWHVREVPPQEGMGLPSAWAANVPFDPADVAGESPTLGYPDATIEALPRDGVVLVVSLVVESTESPSHRPALRRRLAHPRRASNRVRRPATGYVPSPRHRYAERSVRVRCRVLRFEHGRTRAAARRERGALASRRHSPSISNVRDR